MFCKVIFSGVWLKLVGMYSSVLRDVVMVGRNVYKGIVWYCESYCEVDYYIVNVYFYIFVNISWLRI